MPRYTRGRIRRRTLTVWHHLAERIGSDSPLAPFVNAFARRRRADLWLVPFPGTTVLRFLRPPLRRFDVRRRAVPSDLLSQPGIAKDRELEDVAFARQPLYSWTRLHGKTYTPAIRSMWPAQLLTGPSNARAMRKRLRMNKSAPPSKPAAAPVSPETLTAELRAYAAKIGLSAIGITAFQERYHYEDFRHLRAGDTVIVCVLEQNYRSTQMIPSGRAESAVLTTYGMLEHRAVQLGNFLRARGFTARAEGHVGESLSIAYAVEAGLGQLGLNGQLLTPMAGSRVRLHLLTTDASMKLDQPVDYGMEGICDKCRICVERCPAGAIPAIRKESRGVVKAKLNTKRCLPVLGMSAGCAVCMKVCPIQRYGLDAVVAEYERTGKILGKGTDELEGYDWPVDGEHYGPGDRPRIAREVYAIAPDFDPDRRLPVDMTTDGAGAPAVDETAGSFTDGLS